jgi:hypothetical protein
MRSEFQVEDHFSEDEWNFDEVDFEIDGDWNAYLSLLQYSNNLLNRKRLPHRQNPTLFPG